MSNHRQPTAALFTQVDVTTGGQPQPVHSLGNEQTGLLCDVLAAQDRTNELLEELVTVMASSNKRRANELNQWRDAHPVLSGACRDAAEALSRVHVDYLDRITDEINDTSEDMVEGEFLLNEFIDRHGPRLAHLNGVIQVLAQLSSAPETANS